MLIQEIFDIVPDQAATQLSSRLLLPVLAERFAGRRVRVLDLGCGDGRSVDWFRRSFAQLDWTGLDIDESPEVKTRTRTDCEFRTYNGTEIPFADQVFDIVFSNQVFEHVRHPEVLMREVTRVLRTGGVFVGSVSYLEPYHSYSVFNFTPYGWFQISRAAGLTPELMAAGIDSLALIQRSMNRAKADDAWWTLSPLNRSIIEDDRLTIREKNYRMLMFAGQIVFVSRRC